MTVENQVVLKHTFWGGGFRRTIGKLILVPVFFMFTLVGIIVIISSSNRSDIILGIIMTGLFGTFTVLGIWMDFIPMFKQMPIATLSNNGVDVHVLDYPIIPWKNIISIQKIPSSKRMPGAIEIYFGYDDKSKKPETITIFTDNTAYTPEQVAKIMAEFIDKDAESIKQVLN